MAEYDQSGDYGYDIDEIRTALDAPDRRATRRPHLGAHGMGSEMDPDGDYGYDSAHEI